MIYFDYNASTPTDPRVIEAMLPYFTHPGNAASTDHGAGHLARQAVEQARAEVASLIDVASEDIVFTSGATEADNLAILGVMARAPNDAEIIVSAIEHPAALEPALRFKSRLRLARVDENGVVDPDDLRRLVNKRTALIAVMAANNETGAIQPFEEIGRLCAEVDVPFFCDAVQAVGRIRVDAPRCHAALVSISAHKLYGPKGVGALYVRRRPRVPIAPLMFGGGHERNLRPGTLNVPAIVGFGAAARLVGVEREADAARERTLRDRLASRLGELGATMNSPLERTLPQTLNTRIPGVDARALMRTVPEVAFSAGAACATLKVEPSHVLVAQGLGLREIAETVRLSLGRFSTSEEVDTAADALTAAIHDLRRARAGGLAA